MNVLFVNHNVSLWVNVGLTYVMSAVAPRHQVRLIDRMRRRNRFLPYLLEEAARFSPDVIAFSVNSFTHQEAAALAHALKQKFPAVPVVFGGIGPTLDPEETLRHPAVDAICVGEGEVAFAAFVDDLARGQSQPPPGIWTKSRDAAIIRTGPAPFLADVDRFPAPDWNLWDIDAYLRDGEIFPGTLRVLTSRGCPYRCAFCSNPLWMDAGSGVYYRKRAPERVVAEIQENWRRFARRGFTFLMVSDSIFGLERGHAEEFCERYRAGGLAQCLSWGAQMRCGTVDYSLARALRQAGCRRVTVSIESGNDHLRNSVYRKKLSREQIASTVRALQQAGIVTRAFVMIGGPEETPRMFNETLAFAAGVGLSISDLVIIRYAPLPHTELARRIVPARRRRLRSLFCHRTATGVRSRLPAWYFWQVRAKKIYSFLRQGLRLAGGKFCFDILAVLFRGGKSRFIPFISLCSEQRLINWTLVRYKTAAARAVEP